MTETFAPSDESCREQTLAMRTWSGDAAMRRSRPAPTSSQGSGSRSAAGEVVTVSAITRVHIELPDEVHHDAKVAADRRGIGLKAWVTEAIEEKVVRENEPDRAVTASGA